MYCTVEDLKNDISEKDIINLCNDEKLSSVSLSDQTNPVTKRVLSSITDAADEIDGYLRSQYPLPLASIPNRLNKLSRIIARYYLFSRRMQDCPEDIITSYKMALQELVRIQDGDIILNVAVDSGSSQTESAEFKTNKTNNDRIFSQTILSGY